MASADEQLRLLLEQDLFSELDRSTLERLGASTSIVRVADGDVLVREGDDGDCAYLVMTGRFEATTTTGEHAIKIGEVARGELIGELSLLTEEPRSATVRAVRDSSVIRIERAEFEAIVMSQPNVQALINAQLVRRLHGVLAGVRVVDRAQVIAVVTDGSGPAQPLADALAAGLRSTGGRVHVVDLDREVDVADLEASGGIVLLVPRPDDRDLTRWAQRQSDRTFVVVDASAGMRSGTSRIDVVSDRAELVLVHGPTTELPRGTAQWRDALPIRRHHHVRCGHTRDIAKLVRRLTGEEVVLVLGGGGARGLAHLGVHRALEQLDRPVDAVVGVSAGALFGAGLAFGWDAATHYRQAEAHLISKGSPVDPTLPSVALAKGAVLATRLQEIFGGDDVDLTDLWTPMVCLSSNLTTAAAHLHRQGPLWRAIRASMAIPGVFPPVAEREGLLVDGGIIDNLPVAYARALYPDATVIASDVGRKVELPPTHFPTDGVVSGWGSFARRFRRRSQRPPGMVSLMMRLTALGGAGGVADLGDITIDHQLDGIGMFDFGAGPRMVEEGHQRAMEILTASDSHL